MKKLQRGDKQQYVREAINRLGLDAKYLDAAKWIKQKYGVEVADPTFYLIRKEMQQEARGSQPRDGADQSSAAAGDSTPTGAAAAQPETTSAGVTAEKNRGKGEERSQGTAGGARPAAKKPASTAAAPQAVPQPAAPLPQDRVAALVLQAKGLVERLGKEEAKRLIDAL
jgi:hypothetical protein